MLLRAFEVLKGLGDLWSLQDLGVFRDLNGLRGLDWS